MATKGPKSEDTYTPPQRLLVPCAACGATVLRGVSGEGGKVKKLAQPLTPVLGHIHHCTKKEQSHVV